MGRIVIALLLFSLRAYAIVTPGTGNSVQLGGNTSNSAGLAINDGNPSGYFTLYAQGIPGAGNFEPFYRNGNTSQYIVPTGSTTVCYNATFRMAGAGERLQLCSSATRVALNATSITNGTYQTGVAGHYFYIDATAQSVFTLPLTYSFSGAQFPCVQFDSSSDNFTMALVCKETTP